MAKRFRPEHAWLLAILAGSQLLRFVLVAQGGQHFWPDERRFLRALNALPHLVQLDWVAAFRYLALPDHTLFTFLGVVPLLPQYAVCQATAPGALAACLRAPWAASAFLSLFSTASVGLVYLLCRRAGGDRREALWAAFAMACANSLFYYARHLLPYDAGLALGLAAVWIGIGPGARVGRSTACGVVAGLAYQTYNGVWLLVALALFAHAFWGLPRVTEALRRGVLAGVGLVATGGAFAALGWLYEGGAFLEQLLHFSGTVKQGLFEEGWSLVGEYLWHAEGLVLLVWGSAVLYAVIRRLGGEPLPRRVGCALAALVLGYALLAALSTGLERLVVTARFTRPLVPFACLVTGWALADLERRARAGRGLVLAVALAMLCQFALHVRTVLQLEFPQQVTALVRERWGDVATDVTLTGSWERFRPDWEVTNPRLVLLNAQILYPVLREKPAPEGRVLLRAAHPQQYPPFQYEMLKPHERALLRRVDVSMRLVERRAP